MPYKSIEMKRKNDREYWQRIKKEGPTASLRRTLEQRKLELRESSTMGDPLPVLPTELKIPNTPAYGLRIAVIPDTQVKPGVPLDHLTAAGKYIADKRPDVVVMIGDFADMQSLSSYDQAGSVDAEGKRYKSDLDSVKKAMDLLMTPIAKARKYSPMLVLTLGNHEDRINRAIKADPRKLLGVISTRDLGYEDYGWKVYPFLQPVTIGGVSFSHYFPAGVMGKPISTPQMILRKLHMSAIAGHQQGWDIAYSKRADGKALTAIISGSFYQHEETYLSPFTNAHWRGMYFLHEVRGGQFDEMKLSISYLKRRFA